MFRLLCVLESQLIISLFALGFVLSWILIRDNDGSINWLVFSLSMLLSAGISFRRFIWFGAFDSSVAFAYSSTVLATGALVWGIGPAGLVVLMLLPVVWAMARLMDVLSALVGKL